MVTYEKTGEWLGLFSSLMMVLGTISLFIYVLFFYPPQNEDTSDNGLYLLSWEKLNTLCQTFSPSSHYNAEESIKQNGFICDRDDERKYAVNIKYAPSQRND